MEKLKSMFLARAAMTLLLAMLTTIGAWATITGSGTKADPYVLNDVADWATFANIDNASTYWGSDVYVKLSDTWDNSSTPLIGDVLVGNDNTKYCGHFNGNGKTLTMDMDHGGDNVALFRFVDGATFTALHITGTLICRCSFAGGFVSSSSGTVTITSCRSSLAIKNLQWGDISTGGFIGIQNNGTVTFNNCLFDGSIFGENSNPTNCGGFVGWRGGGSLTFNNCLMAGTMTLSSTDGSATFSRNHGENTTLNHCYYKTSYGDVQGTAVGETSNTALIGDNYLGSAWEVSGSSVVPNTDPYSMATATVSGLKSRYLYDNGNAIAISYTVSSLDETQLTPGTHFSAAITKGGETVTSITEMGDYVLTLTGLSPYTGTKTISFSVIEADLIISSAADWDTFCSNVNGGETYSDKLVKLADDFDNTATPITTMVGTSDHKFCGTFDGNGRTLNVNLSASSENCAPFAYIDGATIKNLTVTGTITTPTKFGASIAAHNYGTTDITNCTSIVTIQSTATTSGDGTHGGFVAVNEVGATLNFTNCVFKGKMLGINATSNGGFVGYNVNTQISYTDCMFAPTELTMNATSSSTFNRNGHNTLTRCYYTEALGVEEGKHVSTTCEGNICTKITFGDSDYYLLGTAVITTPTHYDYNDGEAITVTPAMTYDGEVLDADCYTATITKDGNPVTTVAERGRYLLTFTGNNSKGYYGAKSVSIYVMTSLSGSGTKESPYLIGDAVDWEKFAVNISSGKDVYKDYKLAADITDIETMVGTSEKMFCGTFDGNGKTLTLNMRTYGSEYTAPFRYVNGATILRLHTTGSVDGGNQKDAAGLIGCSNGTVTITSCRSSVAISSRVNGDGTHAGFMGVLNSGEVTFTDCLFDGSITGAATTNCGGFVGWRNGTLTFKNCLMAGTMALISNDGSSTFSRNSITNIYNIYYRNEYGDNQGTAVGSMTNAELATALGYRWEVNGSDVLPVIDPSNLAWATVSGLESNYLYKNGNAIAISYTVTSLDGTQLTPDTHFSAAITKGGETVTSITEMGDYVLTLTGHSPYTGSRTLNFTVAEADFIISNVDDWNTFASTVNNEENYYDKTVKLADNFDNSATPITTMVGSSFRMFCGTFDGNGRTLTVNLSANTDECAPFLWLDGATIKNLTVAGTVTTSAKYGASIAVHSKGTTNITNCTSTVTIESTATNSGDCTHGGFVAVTESSAMLYFTNCAFKGKMLGANATNNGGFVGWNGGTHIDYTNCLFAPTELTMSASNSGTFNRNGNNSFTRAYYTNTFGEAQGKQVSASAPSNVIYSMVTAADNQSYYAPATVSGISQFYCYTGETISPDFTVTAVDGTVLTKGTHYSVTISPATVQAKGNYTLTITGISPYSGSQTFNFTVGDGWPYYEEGKLKGMPLADVTVINSSTTELNNLSGWYIVTEDVSYTNPIVLQGDTHIILADGVTMTATSGNYHGTITHIYGQGNNFNNASLYIYGQEKGTGALSVSGSYRHAVRCVNFSMYGGQVTLNGNEYALSAGINDSNRGNVTIKGGKAHFTGNSCVLNVNNLTLGWTNGDDEYYASKWDGKVIIESGKHFWNKDTETEITSDFNGKTLVPAGSYPVNIANAVNGTVETDKTRVLSGHTVTITATPAEGYGIESVSVKDADNVTVAVTNTAIGKYTFTMPDRNVTVSGAFVQMTNDFGNAVITGINDDYIYTSKVIDIGTPVVTLMGNELTKGSDYDISYTLNGASVSQVSAVGDYTLTVTPHTGSPYTGSKSKVFRVLDFTSATLSGVKDVYQYTNSNRTIEGDITVTLTGLTMNETLVPGEDYTVTYKRDGYTFDAMNLPGNYTLTVKGKGRCSACGTLTANFIVLTFEEYDADSGRLITSTTPDDNASVVTSTTTGMGNGWYVATGNVTVSDRIWVSGDAHLVLCDGATLTASRGFEVPSGCSLTIYSQSGNTGRLMAYTSDMYGSAIGHSGVWNDAGTITIHGGEINATSRGDASKTIGGQKSTVTIYGGQVSASYDLNGAGIGGIDATVNLGWCRTSDYIYAKSYYATVNLLNNFVFDDNRQQLVTTANLNSNRRIVPQSAGWFVMFNSQGGTAVAQQTVDNNGTATEPTAPSRTGYTFGGWYTDSQCSDGTAYNFSTAVTQNITLYAKWTLTPFTITTPESFEVTVDGSAATTATIGQTVTLTIKSGYTLTGSITVTDANSQTVALTDKGNDTYEFTMPPSNVNVVAFAGMLEPGWTLVGTYKTQNFTAADTKYYGFVGTANTGTDVGTFVQVGGYVRIKPLRSYLVAPGGTPKTAPAHRSGDSETIPTTLRIRLLGTNGVTTGILQVYGSGFSLRECGVANTVQGADAWYTLDGRKLSGEPTQKGLYINNGKKVIIK